MTYPRLPTPPDPRPDEPGILYGSRVLCYLLAGAPAVLCDDDQLEHALHAATVALAPPDLHPAALARIVETRREMAATLARRRQAAATGPPPTIQPAGPNAGPMARLVPPDDQRPPGGQHADQGSRLETTERTITRQPVTIDF